MLQLCQLAYSDQVVPAKDYPGYLNNLATELAPAHEGAAIAFDKLAMTAVALAKTQGWTKASGAQARGLAGEGRGGERAAAGTACAAGWGCEAAAGGVRRAEDGAAVPRGEGGQRRAARARLPGGGQRAGHAGARAERGAHHRLGQPAHQLATGGGCLYARALPAQGRTARRCSRSRCNCSTNRRRIARWMRGHFTSWRCSSARIPECSICNWRSAGSTAASWRRGKRCCSRWSGRATTITSPRSRRPCCSSPPTPTPAPTRSIAWRWANCASLRAGDQAGLSGVFGEVFAEGGSVGVGG